MRTRAALAVIALVAAGAAAAPDRPACPDTPPPVPWRELRFSAKKLFLSATTTLGVRFLPTAEAAAELRPIPQGDAVPPSRPTVAVLTSTTDLPFGRDEEVVLWLDPGTGRLAQFDKQVVGSKQYRKLRRYTSHGYVEWRTSPADDRERGLPPRDWTKSKKQVVTAAAALPPSTVLTDGYALLYLVSAARLDRPESHLRAAVLSDDQLVVLEFEADGLTRIPVDYEESWPDRSWRRKDTILVRAVRVTGHRAGDDAPDDDVDLGFLGMKGALTIYVEVGTGLPVELQGRASKIGDLRVTLERAAFDAPAANPPAAAP